ncbi:hypothetical protein TYRP_001618 [Tyrophagus putrescentiae]|nr:hypothetical protein TYRP_001618 [Tyrophagus putrescentiae]
MRAYGTKYELPIILQTGKFHHDGQDIFNRPPDGDFNGHNNNNNNFNGFYTVKKFDDSKRMAPESLQNAIGRNAVRNRRPMADFKVPIADGNGGAQSGCNCDCQPDPYQLHQRSYQEKDRNPGRNLNPESNSEDDYNNYQNHFVGKWKWKLQLPNLNNQELGNEHGNSQQNNDNGNAAEVQQPRQQTRQKPRQKAADKTAPVARVGAACDFSKGKCDFENDHYEESRFRYGYNVFFRGKLWYIDHFPQRSFPGGSRGEQNQRRIHGWGRLMSPVYEVPRDVGRDACMLLEFEFDSEGSDHLTVILQESDNSRTILDHLHEQPDERDSMLLRKYVHFIVTGREIRFFIQFTFDTKQQSSQYGVRNFELYWEACPFGKLMANSGLNSAQPMALEFGGKR